jgi:hypothetical protein
MAVFILGQFFHLPFGAATYCGWLINSFCICLSLSRPALPSQLKPPMGVHLFVPSICSDGAACQLFFCHPWSDSQVFLAWLVRWNRYPWKTLPTWQVVRDFCRMFRYFMLGWVLEERVCLLNSIWFRWPIPSSMIDESLGTSFQLDLISVYYYCCYTVQSCHALSIQFWVTYQVSCDSDAYYPWYHLSLHGQLGFVFFSWLCLFGFWLGDLQRSRYANLTLFFTCFCIPAFSLLLSGVAQLEFNLLYLVFLLSSGFHCFFLTHCHLIVVFPCTVPDLFIYVLELSLAQWFYFLLSFSGFRLFWRHFAGATTWCFMA